MTEILLGAFVGLVILVLLWPFAERALDWWYNKWEQ